MNKEIKGCDNTLWKRIEAEENEVWALMYNESFLKSFPLIKEFESFDGIIGWFIVLNKHKKRHLLLLPEKTIGDISAESLKWYYTKPVYDNEGNLDLRDRISQSFFKHNTFKALQYAMFNLGSSSPTEMFNNFFKEAEINSADLSGSYPLCPGSDWNSPSKISERYPCVYNDDKFEMRNWDNHMMNLILSSAKDINFFNNDELPKRLIVPTEWHTLIKNTGNIKVLDMNKNPFISSRHVKNYWCNEINRYDLNTLRISKAPSLEYINIKLPVKCNVDISGAQSLEDIDVVNTINELKCERVMRSMIPNLDNYNFIKKLLKKRKPLARYVSIKMGFFFYTGPWEGLHDYINEFFDWLKHRRYKEINDVVIFSEEEY